MTEMLGTRNTTPGICIPTPGKRPASLATRQEWVTLIRCWDRRSPRRRWILQPAKLGRPDDQWLGPPSGGKTIDKEAVDKYLREVNIPEAVGPAFRKEADKIGGLRGQYLTGLANCIETMWDLAMEILGKVNKAVLRRAQRRILNRPPARALQAASQARARSRIARPRRICNLRCVRRSRSRRCLA